MINDRVAPSTFEQNVLNSSSRFCGVKVVLRRLSFAFVALSLSTGSSVGQSVPAPIWTGFYVGAHFGGGRGEISELSGVNTSGVAGGGQIGYNYQFNQVVLGVEADASIANIGDELRVTAGGVTVRTELANSYLTSLRGRVGLAIGQALIYGTGGVAEGHFRLSVEVTEGNQAVGVVVSRNALGYVFGGGIEYMLSEHLVGRIEGVRYHFNDNLYGLEANYKVDVLRAGISYKY